MLFDAYLELYQLHLPPLILLNGRLHAEGNAT